METQGLDSDLASTATVHGEALPATVAWLGYGGLLPFIVLAAASMLDHHHAFFWVDGLLAYGAVILSFVGALHWGFAMSLLANLTDGERALRNLRFIWSVIPALVAWLALLLPPSVASCLLIAGFITNYWQDRRVAVVVSLPAWYLPLRLRLSVVACLCVALGGLSGVWSDPEALLHVDYL